MKSIDDFVDRFTTLWIWSGLSVRDIARGVQELREDRGIHEAPRSTSVISACFDRERVRMDVDLVVDIAQVLLGDHGPADPWGAACNVAMGRADAATIVTVSTGLPAESPDFTGRNTELERLVELFSDASRGTVIISAVEGMAGIGKTVLATRAGHLLAGQYDFRHVWSVNLRGFHPDDAQPPADPAAVLRQFLLLLGVPAQHMPHDLAGRRAMYRKRLAGQPVLVLLDNAASVDQVRPLLPDTPGSFAIVTTRRSFTELANADRIELKVFTPDEAMDFLRRAAGKDLIESDTATAAEVARLCGYLPLALDLTARRIAARSEEWSLEDHRQQLVDFRNRFHLDDPVRIAFQLSYQDASPQHRCLLRRLSLHPGQDLDVHAAAVLADSDAATTDQHLRDLVDHHLLQQTSPDRYELHDLIRTYAAACAHSEDRLADRREALTRCMDHYLRTATRAVGLYLPYEHAPRPSVEDADTPSPPLPDSQAAVQWLDLERSNLIAMAVHAEDDDQRDRTVRLSETLSRYLDLGAHYRDGETLHARAADVADGLDRGNALTRLGIVCWRTARHDEAATHLQHALAIVVTRDDPDGLVSQARALSNLGIVYDLTKQYELALDHQERALALARTLGNERGQCHTLTALGNTCERLTRFQEAIDYHHDGYDLARHLGDHVTEAVALDGMGLAYQGLKRWHEALRHHEQALAIARGRDRATEGCALGNIGRAHQGLERYRDALDCYKQALAIFQEIGDAQSEAEITGLIAELRGDLSS